MNSFISFANKRTKKVYDAIMERISTIDQINYRIINEFISRKNFYLRPGLIFLTAELFGASAYDALLPAISMQLSNEWMLIHDDIEDNAIQRRGKRALHKIFGEEQAINTGDYLHTLSWEPICEFLYKNRKIGKLVYNKFTDIIKTTISSQSEDLDFSHFVGSFKNINELKYYKIASGKGAYYSVYGPMQLGAIIANQNIKTINILKDIGEPAGIAAQIQNDILDMIEKSKSGIKFQDIYEGKLTLMLIHTVKLANKYEKLQIKKIYSKKQNKTVYDINFIVRLFKKYNSIEYAKEMRDKYGDFAQKKFKEYEQLLPNNKFRRILKDAINAQYKNYKHT